MKTCWYVGLIVPLLLLALPLHAQPKQVEPAGSPVSAVVVFSADGPGELSLKAGEDLSYKTRAYGVALVTFEPEPSVKVVPGLVVRTATGWQALQLRYHAALRKTEHGQVEELWTSLYSKAISGEKQEWQLLETTLSDVMGPEEDSITNTFYSEGYVVLTTLLEGFVSYSVNMGGFEGGAHPYDTSFTVTRDVAGAKKFDFSGPASKVLTPLIKAELDNVNKQRQLDTLDPILMEESSPYANGAVVVDWNTGKTEYRSILDCCSWAENHNQFDLQIEVPKGAAELAALTVPNLVGPNTVEGPDHLRISLDEKKNLTAGTLEKMTVLPIGKFTNPGLLGVYWLKSGETIDLSAIPQPLTRE